MVGLKNECRWIHWWALLEAPSPLSVGGTKRSKHVYSTCVHSRSILNNWLLEIVGASYIALKNYYNDPTGLCEEMIYIYMYYLHLLLLLTHLEEAPTLVFVSVRYGSVSLDGYLVCAALFHDNGRTACILLALSW